MEATKPRTLERQLTVLDVYSISTGAMFSSGFFLLPGLAFAQSGAWMVLAYFLSALMVVPAMLSKAELASAMPRAGGTYYFLDRSMGPLVGTIGGLGTWIALGLKNTFALIGMGAYLGLLVQVDILPVALAFAVLFTVLNMLGTKETARLQRLMVYALVSILVLFVMGGLGAILTEGPIAATRERIAIAPAANLDAVLSTVGLVFVSYTGLTKVAGVAEEVQQPKRNMILGMSLALATAAVIYTLGAYVLVMVLEPAELSKDLTPIASAAPYAFPLFPGRAGVAIVMVAAVAAFASTANAGILAASRYLLAMGRDRLVPRAFRRVGPSGTPLLAIAATGAFVITALLTLDVMSVAKLASAFQLLMFALVNLAVIVMRESQIEGYNPGFRSPLYPWMQVLGIFFSIGLIMEMGRLPMLFSLLLTAATVAWFFIYAKPRVVRRGAILHWFERLGRERFRELEQELESILADTALKDVSAFDDVVLAPVESGSEEDRHTAFFMLPKGHIMERLRVGRRMAGRSLREMQLQERFGVMVIAIDVHNAQGKYDLQGVDVDIQLQAGDRLLVVGTLEQVDAMDAHREDEPTEMGAPIRHLPDYDDDLDSK